MTGSSEPNRRGPSAPVSTDTRPLVAPKVVMMAGNDIISDARVMKYAHTVAQWGIEVTALGIAGNKLRGSERVGSVLVRSPVMPSGPMAAPRTFLQRLSPWFSAEAERKLAADRLAFDARELRSSAGRPVRDAGRASLTTRSSSSAAIGHRVRRAFRRRVLQSRRVVLRARGIPLAMRRRRSARRGPDLGVGRGRQLKLWWFAHTRTARWKRELPEATDWENVLGPILDRAKPDLIHVHDVFMIGVAVQAARRAALRGRSIKLVYDAHEYIPGIPVTAPRTIAAYSHMERQFLPDMDRIITVSDPLAELLQRDHRLVNSPDVVLNAPVVAPHDGARPGVREILELDEDVPLMVYVGAVNRARGVATVVEGLPSLEGVHVAMVSRPNIITDELIALAKDLGVADRFHMVPFVDPEFVPQYVSCASLGLTTMLHAPNYDISVPNKFCEYIVAGLPIVTSDLRAQADLVKDLDIGAVYRAGDAADFVRAVREVLDDRDRIAERIRTDRDLQRRFSWSPQAEVIRQAYHELLGELPDEAWSASATEIQALISGRAAKSR